MREAFEFTTNGAVVRGQFVDGKCSDIIVFRGDCGEHVPDFDSTFSAMLEVLRIVVGVEVDGGSLDIIADDGVAHYVTAQVLVEDGKVLLRETLGCHGICVTDLYSLFRMLGG